MWFLNIRIILGNKKPTSPDKTNWFEFRKKLNGT